MYKLQTVILDYYKDFDFKETIKSLEKQNLKTNISVDVIKINEVNGEIKNKIIEKYLDRFDLIILMYNNCILYPDYLKETITKFNQYEKFVGCVSTNFDIQFDDYLITQFVYPFDRRF